MLCLRFTGTTGPDSCMQRSTDQRQRSYPIFPQVSTPSVTFWLQVRPASPLLNIKAVPIPRGGEMVLWDSSLPSPQFAAAFLTKVPFLAPIASPRFIGLPCGEQMCWAQLQFDPDLTRTSCKGLAKYPEDCLPMSTADTHTPCVPTLNLVIWCFSQRLQSSMKFVRNQSWQISLAL